MDKNHKFTEILQIPFSSVFSNGRKQKLTKSLAISGLITSGLFICGLTLSPCFLKTGLSIISMFSYEFSTS